MNDVTETVQALKSASVAYLNQARLSSEAAQRAEQLKAEAENAAAEAAAIDNNIRTGSPELIKVLRGLTAEVHQARRAATEAVLTGDDPLGAWTRYRLLRARNYGKWQSYGSEYVRLAGVHRPPPGSWGPVMAPGNWDADMPSGVESFMDFFQAAVTQGEEAEVQQGMQDAWSVIEQAQTQPDDAA